ncbi:alpha/beta hydrolase [Parasphingorhabdus halotolerans]|uniref:Monoacylglycerol lipase n=1 Tax=Parasphingorhabdus halotolerans TaxID=2725558 RepID=A0A6H2DQW8_9SPHN|nr:alpha/beta hydrolase [Parasphingorhabdus halotolerans]
MRLSASSKAAGAKLFFQKWLPDTPPKAVILLIHGYAEHSGRYQYFAEHCVNRGYAVFAIDHWGHGKSDGDPGFVPDFSVFHDGVDALVEMARAAYSGLPIMLVGHSMGGLISATYLLENQSKFAAAVLSGPAIKAAEEPSAFLKAISGLLSRFLPKLGVLALDSNGVSRDPKVVAHYLADPLVYNGKMGARLAAEMLNNMTAIQQQASQIELPMLMLHGSNDSLAAAEGSTFLDSKISSPEKQLKIYPGLFHEIFNEPEKDAVLTDMTDWLDARIGSSAA